MRNICKKYANEGDARSIDSRIRSPVGSKITPWFIEIDEGLKMTASIDMGPGQVQPANR